MSTGVSHRSPGFGQFARSSPVAPGRAGRLLSVDLRGRRRPSPEVGDQRLHLGNLAALRLDDSVGEGADPR
jgi:hypothetical protein